MERKVTESGQKVQLSGEIRGARSRLALSQAELAELVGVSRQTVNAWERGRRQPDADEIKAIAHATGVSVARLFGEEAA